MGTSQTQENRPQKDELDQAVEAFDTSFREGATFTEAERGAFAEVLADLTGSRTKAAEIFRTHTPSRL